MICILETEDDNDNNTCILYNCSENFVVYAKVYNFFKLIPRRLAKNCLPLMELQTSYPANGTILEKLFLDIYVPFACFIIALFYPLLIQKYLQYLTTKI